MGNDSLRHLSLLHIADPTAKSVTFGCRQGWYKTWWQRFTGCGPSVVSTIMLYIGAEQIRAGKTGSPLRPDQCLALMEDVWKYVTPTFRGIPNANQFCSKASAFFQSRGMNIAADQLDIPPPPKPRPSLEAVVSFIYEALSKDTPVAFLSLQRGAEDMIDSWHWVTIVSLRYERDLSTVVIDFADDGQLKAASFKNWYDTTKRGGALVSFFVTD